jgi:hypothetical protein
MNLIKSARLLKLIEPADLPEGAPATQATSHAAAVALHEDLQQELAIARRGSALWVGAMKVAYNSGCAAPHQFKVAVHYYNRVARKITQLDHNKYGDHAEAGKLHVPIDKYERLTTE